MTYVVTYAHMNADMRTTASAAIVSASSKEEAQDIVHSRYPGCKILNVTTFTADKELETALRFCAPCRVGMHERHSNVFIGRKDGRMLPGYRDCMCKKCVPKQVREALEKKTT